MKKTLLLTALAAFFAAGTAAADPCTGTNVGTATTGDVTLDGIDATECQIEDGNSNSGPNGNFLADFGSPAFTLLYKQDANATTVNTTFDGLTFSNYSINPAAGTFTFDWSGGPAYIDFVYSMHAGGTSGFWFFDEFLLSPASGTSSGTFTINFLNHQGSNIGAWSNGQFWVRAGDTPPPDIFVPEPASLWLTGLGLIALATLRRRRG